MNTKAILCGILALALASIATAQPVEPTPAAPSKNITAAKETLRVNPLFTEDRITTQWMLGGLFSDTGIGPKVDEINYIQGNGRLGWMLNSPAQNGHPLDGNVEALIELSASRIISSYGEVIIGPTALVRYNFVQPDWFVVPYIQGGAGIVYSDAYENEQQRAIGQAFSFTPQASAGARFLVTEDVSFDAEFMYHHMSNASTADRNLGVNALGGFMGFTYFFEDLWK